MNRSCLCLIIAVCWTLACQGEELDRRVDAVAQWLPELKSRIEKLRGAGQDVSYPLVSFTVLENFVPMMREDLGTSVPSAWGWIAVGGNVSGYEAVHDSHSGRWAMKIFNKTARAPNVYGMMENSGGVTLKQGKAYTLSAWVKCEKTGGMTLTMNGNWTQRVPIEPTGGQWKRFSKSFKPAAGDLGFTPRILIEEPTESVVIDDVALVEGEKAEEGKNLVANGGFEESWSAQRVGREMPDLEKIAARLERELTEAEGGKKLPAVARWTGQQRPVIQGTSLIGPTPEMRPILFVGYGHFSQARNDIEKFPGYGINIIQCGEWGPSAVYPAEGKFDDAKIRQTIDELDRAAKAGVGVDLLISPHYFPGWLLDKYPESRKGRADFFPYSIYHPKVRELLKKFCAEALPPLRGKPALVSICLSNEPINCQDPDEYSTKEWHEWLAKKHGEIATLNARWKTKFAKFEEIPQPNALNRSAEARPSGHYMDFIRWNQESFTAFHKMLADAVHAALPDVPVHIKDTTWHKYRSESVQAGNDVTLFGGITEINGNDSVNLYGPDKSAGAPVERSNDLFAQGWRENALAYDLQCSAHLAPVFNSENHLIFDREIRYIPPEHVRAGLWQEAIHGQSATTIWVWEREKSNPRGDFAGDIMERPGCAEAAGIACLDLNRVAKEVAAIQNAPAQVLILQSFTSAVWDGHRYDDALMKLYTALSFTGLKIGFVTERQLEAGTFAGAALLFVPGVTHLSDAAFANLVNFGGKMVFVGGDELLSKNEYDQPRETKIPEHTTLTLEQLKSTVDGGARPLVNVTSEQERGVVWRCAKIDDGIVVNLYNPRREVMTVKLSAEGHEKFVDALSGEAVANSTLAMKPLEVRICRTSK